MIQASTHQRSVEHPWREEQQTLVLNENAEFEADAHQQTSNERTIVLKTP
jgi:hypothetical protein